MRTTRKLLALNILLAAALPLAGYSHGVAAAPLAPASTSVGMSIDDTVLTARVKSALLTDPGVKSFDFKVETRKGVVLLSGFVDNESQIEHAIATTRAVAGVNGVENNITLKDGKVSVGNRVDDGFITTGVKSALLADPNINSFDIAVVTRKGEVQLSGYVNNQQQIDQAMVIARGIEGVTSVTNEMRIKK